MGAIILNGAKIGKNTMIAAGTLVSQNKEIPEGVLVMGVPGKVVRKLTEDEIESIKNSRREYVKMKIFILNKGGAYDNKHRTI